MTSKLREQCEICIENITASKRVECPFCSYVCCRPCYERYILSSADDSNCMKCHRSFDREVIMSICTKSFVNNKLKKHRETCLCEREMSMMTSTQIYVEQELQKRENQNMLDQIQHERMNLKRKMRELDRTYQMINANVVPHLDNFERRSFVHRCSVENCNGYLSSQWKCNICLNYVCPDCNAVKGPVRDAEHVCNEDEKKTMELLRRDSKKCPGCGECIFKVSGCDQMWCTTCHTAFSWRTGQKVNGVIHNPHYYAFMRNHTGGLAREHGDIPCGGIPTFRELSMFLKPDVANIYNFEQNKLIELILRIHRIVGHVDNVERHRYPTELTANANLDLRIVYMLGELEEAKFKSKLQQREKNAQKRREIGLVLQMFVDTSGDIYRQMILQGVGTIRNNVITLSSLINYTNTSMNVIAKRYDCVCPMIDLDRGQIVTRRAY